MRRVWKSKKILSLILALVLLAGTITGAVYAGEDGAEPEATASEAEVSEAAEADPEPEAAAEAEVSAEPEASAEPSAEPTMNTAEAEEEPETETTYTNSISGMLWLDMFDDSDSSIYAGDGVRQSEEEPLAGYTVELFKADDTSTAVQTATTDADGTYEFTGLEPGDYVVGVKTGTIGETEYLLPLFWLDGKSGDNRFVATLDEEADAYIYAYTDSITVGEDTAVTDVDAGMRTVPKAQPMAGSYIVTNDTTTATIGTYTTLAAAVTACVTTDPCTITATMNDTAIGSAVTIPSTKTITLTSDSGGPYIITQTTTVRHFTVSGGLTLEDIVLDGVTNTLNGGGVQVNSGGSLTMNSGAVMQNCYANMGGGCLINGGGSLTMDSGAVVQNCRASSSGGGVFVSGSTFTMNDGEISGNTGSGVCVMYGGTFDMQNGKISGNTGSTGSGVYVDGSGSTFDMQGGEISGNTAINNGGGVAVVNSGAMTMDNATKISGNTATVNGGGVFVGGGAMTMNNGKISGNTAAYGGGVFVNNSNVIIIDGLIDNNTATTDHGGGIYLMSNSDTLTMTGGSITNNKAPNGAGGGIYTSDFVNYANLDIDASVVFSGNTAILETIPPAGASTLYPNIKTTSSSTMNPHPLNNYDINTLYVKVNYVDRNGNPIGSPSFEVYGVEYGDPFSLPAAQIPTITGYAYVGWNNYSATGTPGTSSVTLSAAYGYETIYLIYGRDKGTSGEDSNGLILTPNNVEDFDITREWQMDDGTPIAGLTDQVVIMDVGDYFTLAHDNGVTIPSGIGCIGYYLSSDPIPILHTGNPNYLVNETDGDVTVTYVYATVFTVTEKFVDESTGASFQSDSTMTVPITSPDYTFSGSTANVTVGTDTYVYVGYKFDSFVPGDTLDGIGTTPSAVTLAGNRTVYYVYHKLSSTISVTLPTGMDFYVDETTNLGVESGPIGGGGGDYYEFENNSDRPVYIDLTSMTVNSATANLDVVDDVSTTTSTADDILHLNLLKATTGNSSLPIGTPNGFTGSDVNNVMPDAVGSYGASVSGTYGTGVARLGVLDGTFVQQSTPTDTKGYTTLSGTYDGTVTTTAKTANLTFTFTYDLAP